MKTGVVDVGGGLRGIYAAGVLDFCMEKGIRFDLGIGVSAGSANLASYCAGQPGRNLRFYSEYTSRKQYMSLGNFLRTKSYFDMDYVYGTLSHKHGEDPLDYPAMRDHPMEFIVVATDARTGQAKYFDKSALRQDCYDILKASSSIPFVCQPYVIGGVPYFDGALGDPVPMEKAFQLGCERVVLLLTKPEDIPRNSRKDEVLAAFIKRKYPLAAKRLRQRAEQYNESVALAQKYAKEGRVLIVAPEDTCGVDTLTKDREALRRLYELGYKDGRKIAEFL